MDLPPHPMVSLVLLTVVYMLYRRFTRISIALVPGPKPDSFLLGKYCNLCELLQKQAGETDFKWQTVYGDVVRFKGAFGDDRLLISDPKALQYIFQTSGYKYPKQPGRREISRLLSGRGITWADGDTHKRHRKIMLPAFGAPESKSFVPLFTAQASQLCTKWRDMLDLSQEESAIVDIPPWISRATLDAIGEAAFDYKFGALDHELNPLRKAYENLFSDLFGSPTKKSVLTLEIMLYTIPEWFLRLLTTYMPSRKLERLRRTAALATDIARSLVRSKAKAVLQGNGNRLRDVMSLLGKPKYLVKANGSENINIQMSEEEMLAQMRTMMLAGHETTANTLTWNILELARHQEVQQKLRREIRDVEKAIHARGDTDFTAADFEGMVYLTAVVKESLRYNPVALFVHRQAENDDCLPLSKPMATSSGEMIYELPIPKGLKIMASISGYNRNKDIFGDDAHVFNPERWLNGQLKKATSVGVYGNLMTFSAGVRSCIGWKFAVLELQAFLVELVNNFEFSLTPELNKMRREACSVMIPTIEGEEHKGAQLPLKIKVALREE